MRSCLKNNQTKIMAETQSQTEDGGIITPGRRMAGDERRARTGVLKGEE